MTKAYSIAFFGSSLVSAYWNGAATYYRGIIKALHQRGHHITFFEPDAFERQQHRDLSSPSFARSVVYEATEKGVRSALDEARDFDVVVKASGVGVFDQWLERAVLELADARTTIIFWDVDAPATLDRMSSDEGDPFAELVSQYDLIFTYGGGDPVVEAYEAIGARKCVPIYNALDPDTHFPVDPEPRFEGIMGFLGNRLPDREERVEEFFFKPAALLRGGCFQLGGSGWGSKAGQHCNVSYAGHVYTRDHNAFNASQRAVLNISRESMARYGFSPATRVFEAAGAGACIITDAWEGISTFLTPGIECLVAHNGDEVAGHLLQLTKDRAQKIGSAARRQVLNKHTYNRRAAQVEEALSQLRGGRSRVPSWSSVGAN